MSDEPAEQDPPATSNGGGLPAFLTGAKGWVTGLTSLAVAATAMFAAFGNLLGDGDKSAAPQAAASVPAATPAAPAEEEADAPLLYEGDGNKLEWSDSDDWTYTTDEGSWPYEEMVSTTTNMMVAYNKEYNSYLRWPMDGGPLEESTDDKASWTSVGKVYPPA